MLKPFSTVKLNDTLIIVYPDYDQNYSTKLQFNEIILINDFVKKSDHFRITDYTLEYRICRKHSSIYVINLVEVLDHQILM